MESTTKTLERREDNPTMSHNVIDGCFHEKEWGELASERRRWEAHMVNTVESLDAIRKDIGELKLMLHNTNNALTAAVTAMTAGDNQLRADLDRTAKKIWEHTDNHCTGCKNEKSLFAYAEKCSATTDDVEAMKLELEILYPMARTFKIIRDKIWYIIIGTLGAVVLANILGIEVGVVLAKILGVAK